MWDSEVKDVLRTSAYDFMEIIARYEQKEDGDGEQHESGCGWSQWNMIVWLIEGEGGGGNENSVWEGWKGKVEQCGQHSMNVMVEH